MMVLWHVAPVISGSSAQKEELLCLKHPLKKDTTQHSTWAWNELIFLTHTVDAVVKQEPVRSQISDTDVCTDSDRWEYLRHTINCTGLWEVTDKSGIGLFSTAYTISLMTPHCPWDVSATNTHKLHTIDLMRLIFTYLRKCLNIW